MTISPPNSPEPDLDYLYRLFDQVEENVHMRSVDVEPLEEKPEHKIEDVEEISKE